MSYEFYKILHIGSVIGLFLAYGGVLTWHIAKAETSQYPRKFIAILHGVTLTLVFVAGFGLMARLGIIKGSAWPLWVWIKLGIWIALGGLLNLAVRKPRLAVPVLAVVWILGIVAASLAITKPV